MILQFYGFVLFFINLTPFLKQAYNYEGLMIMSINKQLILSLFLVFMLFSCDLNGNKKEESTKITLKIDGEEIVVKGSSNMVHQLNGSNWIPSKGTIRININNKGWGDMVIQISEFTGAQVYEANYTYAGKFITVELADEVNRKFINNDTGEKTKIAITGYEKEKFIEGESTFKLKNKSVISVSFYINNVSYSTKAD